MVPRQLTPSDLCGSSIAVWMLDEFGFDVLVIAVNGRVVSQQRIQSRPMP